MKVLSKYFKVALCFMAFALCSFMFAFTPTFTAVEAANMAVTGYNVAINAIKMPTEVVDYEQGDRFHVPLLSTGFGEVANPTGYTIRVITPSGNKHDYVVGGTNTDSFFGADFTATEEDETNYGLVKNNKYLRVNAQNAGDYKVIYIVTEGVGTSARNYYSNTYKVTVENVSYELDFSSPVLNENKEVIGYTKNILPKHMAVSSTPYELPVAYAKVKGQELSVDKTSGLVTDPSSVSTTGPKVLIKVTKDGAPQTANEDGSVLTFVGDKYYITPSEAGVYTVEYSYPNSEIPPVEPFRIEVEEGFVAQELKLASTPTMPTIELGKTIKLPKITVNAGTEKNVDVNVTRIVVEKENTSIACVLENNNFEFEMTPENFGVDSFDKLKGNYRITYTVVDAHGKTLTETFKVDGVTVSSKPTIKLAYNFDKNNTENVVLGAETELKAEYASNYSDGGIVLPAAYVEDAVTRNYDDFIIVRTIKKGNTYYYIDNKRYDEDLGRLVDVESTEKGYNAAEVGTYGDTTKAAVFKFNSNVTNAVGTYNVEYRVISKNVKERENYLYIDGTTTRYSFKVVESTSLRESTPSVLISNLNDSSVKNTDQITVRVTATDDVDTRLKNAVFTYSGETAHATDFATDLKVVIDNLLNAIGTNKTCNILDDQRLIDGIPNAEDPSKTINGLSYYYTGVERVKETETKNSFALNLKEKTGTVNVVAVALNDMGKVATNSKVLTIRDTANDFEAPSIYIKNATDQWKDAGKTNIVEFQVGQGKEVKLPVVYFADTADKTLRTNVMYYVDSPVSSSGVIDYLSPNGKSFYYGTETVDGVPTEVQYVDGGTIVTSQTGIYYVAYTATDVAGNTSVMYFTFEVVDTSKPILTVEPVADDVTISGNTITAGKGAVIDFETTLKSSDGKNDYSKTGTIEISVDDANKGLHAQPSGRSRTSWEFNSYGTYYVTISGKYTTVVNGEDVVLEADNKVIKVVIEKQEIEWLGEFNIQSYAGTNELIKLPDVAASNGATVTVTYRTPGAAESEAKTADTLVENGYTYWTFTTDDKSKGTYTVTYTAETTEDVLTKTFKIKVGDNVAPTLTFNQGELTQDLVFDGQNDIEYVVEVNKANKTFVVKAVNNGQQVYSHNIGLVIGDKDDTGRIDNDIAWTNLSYELTGDNVTKGSTTTSNGTTTTQYLITGTGKYSLKLTMKDSYDNERVKTIDFNVVEKSTAQENNDTVVGAVLIVVSLILLAGVILFFTFTGKKGSTSKTKTKKTRAPKAENVSETKAEEATVENTETKAEEEVKEEKVDDEPKSGEVE